ncbi:MAG: histidine phosphatase family protein [bacterium]
MSILVIGFLILGALMQVCAEGGWANSTLEMMKLNVSYKLILLFHLIVAGWSLSFHSAVAADEAHIWKLLQGEGHFALLRHALAPGTGDPAEFSLKDCDTQRNLSEEGRGQALQIGERFRDNGVDAAEVYSSQWCRCLETAELLKLGAVQPLKTINSFYQNFERKEKQTATLESWIRSQSLEKPIILVTHQVNITALTGELAASGELVIVRVSDGAPLKVVGKLQTD